MPNPRSDVPVWDPLVRAGHWILVAAFVVAYLTEGEPEDVHVVAGYFIGAYVVVRILWGFVGPRHARFSDFVRGPREVVADLAGLFTGRRPRYLGHNPAGGAMIVVLLICLTATVVLGMATYADAENEGPLAPWLGEDRPAVVVPPGVTTTPHASPEIPRAAKEHDESEEEESEEESESVFTEWHELFANLTVALVLLHVLGVIVDSRMHRENLVTAMITGRKAVEPRQAPERDD